MKLRDLTGQVYGRLTVLRRAPLLGELHTRIRWVCQCSCGEITVVHAHHLVSGNTRSCGCLRTELATERFRLHRRPKKSA